MALCNSEMLCNIKFSQFATQIFSSTVAIMLEGLKLA